MQTKIFATISAAALSAALGLSAAYAQAPDNASPAGATPAQHSPQGMTQGGNSTSGMTHSRDEATGGSNSAESGKSSSGQIGERASKQDETKDHGKSAKAAEKDRMDGDRKSAETGKKDRMDRDRKSAETGDRDLIDRDRKSAETSDRDRLDRDRKSAETGDRDRIDRDRKSAETGDRDRLDRDRKSAETGDRNADREHAGKSVKIDADQKEKVRTYFSEHRPTANRVEKSRVTVSIGASLPSGIVLAPLPSDIVVVAADCPLQYFVWGDDIVLVDSCSRHVVDIIPNIG